MKLFNILILLTTILFFSCNKNDTSDQPDNPVEQKDTMMYSMIIDGKAWTPTDYYFTSSVQSQVPKLYATNTSYTLVWEFDGGISVGSYDIKSNNKVSTDFTSYIDKVYNFYTIESGTLNITKYDSTNKIIKGTFEFVAKSGNSTVNVTNGKFYIDKFR